MKKKVLILGGKPIGSCEITKAANELGCYTIVTDYLPVEESAAKRISNEHWEISTADIAALKMKCEEEKISTVLTGVHEFNIERKIELCDLMNYPQYCSKEQWDFCENKKLFKDMCVNHNIDVARSYDINNAVFPVIVKPTDSSGSRGFSICRNKSELVDAVKLALKFSPSGTYLIEEFLECEACIVHYTAIEGRIVFCGMSDKHSQILRGGSSVMALQTFPSTSIERYLKSVNDKAIQMFKDLGVKNGPIWIEVFNDTKTGRFVFNEMGYRFGGSLTNYPVKHFYGIDQMELMIKNALNKSVKVDFSDSYTPPTKKYCILPIHLLPGTINEINGVETVESLKGVNIIVQVHYTGDIIEDWGTAQQVFCYLHVMYDNNDELKNILSSVRKSLSVKDSNNKEMIYYLFDLKKLGVE